MHVRERTLNRLRLAEEHACSGKLQKPEGKVLKAPWAVELRDSGQFSPDIRDREVLVDI